MKGAVSAQKAFPASRQRQAAGLFLGVLAKTQFVQNAKTQFENTKTQFENAKTQFENLKSPSYCKF